MQRGIINMGLGDKWKKAGKSIGGAFSSFGKAMGDTAKVAFTDEDKDLGESWKKTGQGFAEAGKDLGTAAEGTADKIVGEEEEEPKKEPKKDNND